MSTKNDPYVDGLKAVGERKISRDQKVTRHGKMFSSVIPRDPWQHRQKISESIRTGKALETILDQQPTHIQLAVKTRKGSPRHIINKDLELKTYEYKVFTTYDTKNAEVRNAKTGKILDFKPS